ncbi:hypothetical protein D3C78_1683470 [compost metagenome]
MDERLGRGAATAAFAHRYDPCIRAVFEYHAIDQVIDQHHIRFLQCAHRLEGQQFRITGSRAHQPDFCVHRVFPHEMTMIGLKGKTGSAMEHQEQQRQVGHQRQQGQSAPYLQRFAFQ